MDIKSAEMSVILINYKKCKATSVIFQIKFLLKLGFTLGRITKRS